MRRKIVENQLGNSLLEWILEFLNGTELEVTNSFIEPHLLEPREKAKQTGKHAGGRIGKQASNQTGRSYLI